MVLLVVFCCRYIGVTTSKSFLFVNTEIEVALVVWLRSAAVQRNLFHSVLLGFMIMVQGRHHDMTPVVGKRETNLDLHDVQRRTLSRTIERDQNHKS